jgi:polyisoprenoid-binding protein YceI
MKHRLTLVFTFFLVALSAGLSAQTSKWDVDLGHSSILASVRHAASPFVGLFKNFSGTVTWDATDVSKCAVSMSVDPKSYDSFSEDRDDYIKSKDFFDADSHGDWTFKSSAIRKDGDNYIATGTLTARGVSKEIAVPFQFLGTYDAGKYGGVRAGISAQFSIVRSAFSLGGDINGLLSDEVKVTVNLELGKE